MRRAPDSAAALTFGGSVRSPATRIDNRRRATMPFRAGRRIAPGLSPG